MVNFIQNIKANLQTKIVYIISIIILLIIIIVGYFMFVDKQDNVSAKEIVKQEKVKENKKEKEKTLKVDVKGAVKNPGVYELSVGNRVIDAVNKAGGLTNDANTDIINLSKKLEDGFVIVIYTNNDLKQPIMDKYVENNYSCPSTINDACIIEGDIQTDIKASKTNTSTSSNTVTKKTDTKVSNTNNEIINLNNASLEQLQTLTGIGESKAKAIIEYRETNGNFKDINELTNVSGIGNSTVEKIKDKITV